MRTPRQPRVTDAPGVNLALCGQVEEGATVAVFGLGGVGLGVIQGARLAKAGRIIAVDINAAKAGLAMDFGATDFVNPNDYRGRAIQVCCSVPPT